MHGRVIVDNTYEFHFIIEKSKFKKLQKFVFEKVEILKWLIFLSKKRIQKNMEKLSKTFGFFKNVLKVFFFEKSLKSYKINR